MKSINIFRVLAILALTLTLSTSAFAQEKPAKPAEMKAKKECTSDCKKACCTTEKAEVTKAKHKCADDCKKACCADKKADSAKHVCTDECKTAGCDVVKAKECKTVKHVCTDECKTAGCDAVKATYECPMKCEPASHKPGECSKCGMELKKKA